jgi:HPr kinase/phosphorylase
MFDNIPSYYNVKISKIMEPLELTLLNKEVDIDNVVLHQSDVNRPALQLAGFFEHFDYERLQIVGMVESAYVEERYEDHGLAMYEKIFQAGVPCVVFCRDLKPADDVIELATKYNIPLLMCSSGTCGFMNKAIRFLQTELAPRISIHGVLVDVFGEGVLITGESGIGKSEAALELIKRGHRLVSDDVVEIKKISDTDLIGSAPSITRHFIELRGIGIVDVKTLFGIQSVLETQKISLVIHLEEWNREREYDRLGLDDQYTEYLGNKVVYHSIPIRPGRNVAMLVESAAINHRQKKMGYNAAHELYRRVTGNLQAKQEGK